MVVFLTAGMIPDYFLVLELISLYEMVPVFEFPDRLGTLFEAGVTVDSSVRVAPDSELNGSITPRKSVEFDASSENGNVRLRWS